MSDLHVRYMNEGATKPLIVPVQVLVNTPPNVLFEHIKENSKNCRKWIKQEGAHNGVAILCGSGPSIHDDLDEIRERAFNGATIFALNAAAKFLADNGIMPDYQVIIDAKEETVSLVGPAKNHIFGSTVHPDCFKKAPNAQLVQLQVDDDQLQEEIDELAPDDYSMLSTAVSVGVVSSVLTFVMGYREMHFYGYDSCHKGDESHVVRQAMNDVVPCMEVDFCGNKYLASYPMKMQAERFMSVSRHLKDAGCNLVMHGTGLLPDMFRKPVEELTEKEKYKRMWTMLSYREYSPAERLVDVILDKLKPEGTIIDFGCGTGRAAVKISNLGHKVVLTDFACNSRDEVALNLPFVELDLTESIPLRAKQGYCIDVMEHIEPEKVETVINNIMTAVQKAFFQISLVSDKCGVTIGQELHLTVRPFKWWVNLFTKNGYKVSWSEERSDAGLFLVER